MRALFITSTAGAITLLLSGCPDMPGGSVPAKQSESQWKSSHLSRGAHDGAVRAPHESSVHGAAIHHGVSEIAWFQGTIDEAFSRRGCHDSHPQRTVFRF